MHQFLVKEQYISSFHRNGTMVRTDKLIRNIDLEVSSLPFIVVAMQRQIAAMTAWYDLQAAILNRGIQNRDPN
jgi:hypothetical protein